MVVQLTSFPLDFRAAILEKIGGPLALDSVRFAGPLLTGHVLVKLRYSGICGKQMEEIYGKGGPDPFLPHLLGHEGSGEVLAVGPGVKKVKEADTVVLHWRKGTGIDSTTPLYARNGARVNAGWVTTFNELAVVSENRVTVIPPGSDLRVAALLGCAVTTGASAVLNAASVQSHDTVAVFGCGGVGLCAVQAAHLRHPAKLIAVDVNPESLKRAQAFGATDVIHSREEDVVRRIHELTQGKGAGKVIVCVGHPEAIATAVEATSIPGECLLVGIPPKGAKVAVDPFAITHHRTLRGALGGDCVPDRDIPNYLRLHEEGRLQLDKLISRVEPMERINALVEEFHRGTSGRLMVKF